MDTAHYYFHILDDGTSVPDDEGMFLSRHAARAELRASVCDLANARMRLGRGPGNGSIQLADDDGQVLETLRFSKVLN